MEVDKFEPGAAKYGNFINYYQFNSAEDRVSMLPPNLLSLSCLDQHETIVCLDIGCNIGKLTEYVYNYLLQCSNENTYKEGTKQGIYVIAVDIDATLIERANESNDNKNITYLCLDIIDVDSTNVLTSLLKSKNKTKFDIVFAFSITMWIHLNFGDTGLEKFLQIISNYSDIIFLEPQPWKCYQNAVRRMKRCKSETFDKFDELRMRNQVEKDINNYLENVCKCKKIYESVKTKWNRVVSVYEVLR